MDEQELAFYEMLVFGDAHPFGEEPADLAQNIWDQDGMYEGCYRVLPADVD